MSDNNGLKGSLAGETRNYSNEVKVSTNERYKFDFGTPEEPPKAEPNPVPLENTKVTTTIIPWKKMIVGLLVLVVVCLCVAGLPKLIQGGRPNETLSAQNVPASNVNNSNSNLNGVGGASQEYSGGTNKNNSTSGATSEPSDSSVLNTRLSDSCDNILCVGFDTAGNKYELVANQTENSLGYEIVVGVIKNNEWLYPLSSSFPFLGERGLFHVNAPLGGSSGTALTTVGEQNTVIQSIYFIDSGAFLMDSYTTNNSLSLYDHTKIIFSCDSLESKVFDCDTNEYTLKYESTDAKLDSGTDYLWYGEISTDNGSIVVYETIRNSVYQNDDTYDWYVFNCQTFNQSLIASNVDIYPRGPLSGGLILGSDDVFYDTQMNRIVDLSAYNIYAYMGACFHDGQYTFESVNSIGTHFYVTIDQAGHVISEIEI